MLFVAMAPQWRNSTDFDGDELGDIGNVEEDEMSELEALVDGQPRTVPLVVLWYSGDGSVSVAVPW